MDARAVNDPFTLKAWAKEMNVGNKVDMLADWNGDFTRMLEMEIDLSEKGLGKRSNRFSMVIEDGKITLQNVEKKSNE